MLDSDIRQAMAIFVEAYRDRFAAYHRHKEAMAYAGFAFYLASAGAALVSAFWPIRWSGLSPSADAVFSILLALLMWCAALWYLRWQLIRRRLAAVRVAGAEALLAKWLTKPPEDADRQPWRFQKKGDEVAAADRWWHFFWPPATPMPKPDVPDNDLPAALVAECRRQDYWNSTQALGHERGLYLVGYAALCLLVLRCVVNVR